MEKLQGASALPPKRKHTAASSVSSRKRQSDQTLSCFTQGLNQTATDSIPKNAILDVLEWVYRCSQDPYAIAAKSLSICTYEALNGLLGVMARYEDMSTKMRAIADVANLASAAADLPKSKTKERM